jgi:NhaD family Na+/H+ antiporter
MDMHLAYLLIIFTFVIGYSAIILEFWVKVNKTAVGILIAGLCWMFYFLGDFSPLSVNQTNLSHHLSEVSQVIFFLLGAMTIVELIDSHKGFSSVIQCVTTRSKRKVLIIIAVLAFFLSAVLDNLTTTILLISILRKLVPDHKERLSLGCLVVIAANAGGAWTPIGDVTTTMLWINDKISTIAVMKALFLPSIVSLLVPLACFLLPAKGEYGGGTVEKENEEPGAKLIFWLGLLALIAVPVIKSLTGLPPYMGVLIGLAVLWLVTDILHFRHAERNHLRVPFVLTKIDVSSILFFLGILLTITALDSVGILGELATWITTVVPNITAIATLIGLFSAIIDNVPLVAATMGMYNYPMDHTFWLLIAYTAGTGGSILSIGSAAGVALMGLERVDFISYLKKTTVPALLGYFAGIGVYIALQ